MRVIFRVDASLKIGSGHVMRCLTLAEELSLKGYFVSFFCRDCNGNLNRLIEARGFDVKPLEAGEDIAPSIIPAEMVLYDWVADAAQTIAGIKALSCDVDWLVVDSYFLDFQWEEKVKPVVEKLLVIDDLANRKHTADLLLDQNYYENLTYRYRGLLRGACLQLLGQTYSLLRTEFVEARKLVQPRCGDVRRIFVFFGGVDLGNETMKALVALSQLGRLDIAVDVVVGAANPYRDQLSKFISGVRNIKLHHQVNNIAKLMAAADLALCAGGSTTWERCCLGLPTITIAVADNQIKTCEDLAKLGAHVYLGASAEVTPDVISQTLGALIANPKKIKSIATTSAEMVDGMGGQRVVSAMLSF